MSLFALFYMLCAYLLGSISSAILICRIAGLPDPRQNGSCTPDVTNVFRIGNYWAALIVLILDLLKGMLPVWAVAGSMFGTWILIFLVSRYASLSAVLAALLVPFYVWWFKPEFTFPVALVCCLLIYRHHDNIQRLWRGQEDKVWSQLKKK